ncbi:MAG: DUF4113 domain-containing protein [Pyrinomonadaceae bacterium]
MTTKGGERWSEAKGRWRTKAAKRSPRYTTRLSDVPLLS